ILSCPHFSQYRYADHQQLPSSPTRRSSDLVVESFCTSPPASGTRYTCFSSGESLVPANHTQPACASTASRASTDQSPEVSGVSRSEEHTSELQSRENLVCRLLLDKKK